jgi:hypothetical protein
VGVKGKGLKDRSLTDQDSLVPFARLWRAHSNWILAGVFDVPPFAMGTL